LAQAESKRMSKPKRPAASRARRKNAVDGLLRILDLEPLEVNLFRGVSPDVGWQRVYGGQVLAQALTAAVRTVPAERIAHSLHAYFLLPGDPAVPIIYEVERIRDGGSFTTRRVKGIQHGRAMFSMSISFQKVEEGYDHQSTMPDAPPPEDLPNERELAKRLVQHLPDNMRAYWERERPIEMRPVDVERYFERTNRTAAQHIWMRANGTLPAEPALHQCVLAYASDFTLLDTALIAHGKLMFDPDIQLASLDHALWFHRPFRADEWLLYVQDSPSASGARGFCRGSIYRRDGALVASVTQEGLMRKRDTRFVVR
jgi:acyl-CoA thioesterase II